MFNIVDSETKILLTLKEACDITGIGQTKMRSIIKSNNSFSFKIGKKIYISKDKLIKWINSNIENNINI